ncbi:transporter [Comamonas phosphati]|nr:transporter [Comamonas phosphati]
MKLQGFAAVVAMCSALFSGAVLAHPDAAHVEAQNAWARASVPGQQGSGAFMRLTAKEPLTLVGVETPVAGVAEVHEMKMDGDVMRMRAIEALELPQGVAVDLKPGGYHIMLQQLKAPLAKDTQAPITLVFKNAKGEVSRLHLQVPVRMAAPAGGDAPPAQHGHMH